MSTRWTAELDYFYAGNGDAETDIFQFDEFHELGDYIESGPDWRNIIAIRTNLNPLVTDDQDLVDGLASNKELLRKEDEFSDENFINLLEQMCMWTPRD